MSEHEKKKSSQMPVFAGLCAAGIVIGVVGTLAFNVIVKNGDPVVAQYNGKSVRASEAYGNVKTRLFDLEEELFRTKEQAVNEYVDQKLLEAEARKQNIPVEQLVEKETGGDVGEINDKDIEDFLGTKGLSLKDPRIRKDDVKEYLKYRKRFDKRQSYVAKLRSTSNVKLFVTEPESPKLVVAVEGYPTWGNPKAPVTIVEFSDFECPFCSKALPVIKKEIKEVYGPDKVRIVFRDMPLPSHSRANPAALAAHCANEQGKFWEFHDTLFGNQSKLSDADFKKDAKELGMDEAKFTECYDNKRHQPLIEKSKREAESIGIQATPSFVINGVLLQGAQPFERFKEKIDHAKKG